jgi:hypothetical protein
MQLQHYRLLFIEYFESEHAEISLFFVIIVVLSHFLVSLIVLKARLYSFIVIPCDGPVLREHVQYFPSHFRLFGDDD